MSACLDMGQSWALTLKQPLPICPQQGCNKIRRKHFSFSNRSILDEMLTVNPQIERWQCFLIFTTQAKRRGLIRGLGRLRRRMPFASSGRPTHRHSWHSWRHNLRHTYRHVPTKATVEIVRFNIKTLSNWPIEIFLIREKTKRRDPAWCETPIRWPGCSLRCFFVF